MSASGLQAIQFFSPDGEQPDPKKLNYCGYTCPNGCEFRKASLENNPALKKKAYETWNIEKRYGISFEADKVFCYGCKIEDKPAGVVTANCTVRSCAIEKELDACIECKELKNCDKELWDLFPDFHKQVIALQKQYLDS